ncbi:MAG TPA: caspase family protein [Chitinophagaceae bacterium]|nr:caspase family protein [Chitinophagaceae bacterium]
MRNALIIGINDYPTAPLKACINDAEKIAELLAKNEDGSKNFRTILLKNIVNKAELRQALIKLFNKKSDIALVYFAGHGSNDFFGYHIVTPDSVSNDMGVPMSQLLSIVNRSPAKNKIIILDCCRAGGIDEINQDTGMSVYLREGVIILASSRSDQLSKEVNGHGVFTNLLIEALKGGAADLNGNVTPGSIYAFIDKALGPSEQRPVFKTNISEFISLRQVTPQVPAGVIQNLLSFFATPDALFPLNPSYEDTNHPDVEHKVIEPYADADNVAKFKQLQKLQSVGLVVPVDAPFMFFAAMESKSCRLTALGYHYWRLAKQKKI